MYLPGYYSVRDLHDGTGNGSWPSHHEDKPFGQYYGIFSSRPTIDEYIEYDREQFRQTILKHETIFRHQLHELHRLHKTQMSMMNEVRSQEPYKQLNPMGPSKQLNPMGASPSCFYAVPPDDDKKRWHNSSLPLVDFNCRMESVWGADSMLSHFKPMNVGIMKSTYASTQNVSKFKDHESLESKCNKVERRLFDLELPADNYLSDGEEEQVAAGGSEKEAYPPNQNCRAPCEKNGHLFTHHGMYLGDALSSNTLHQRRPHGFTDLNEPVQIEEASSTSSVDILGDVTCSKGKIGRRDLSANSCSGLQCKGKEISQSPFKEKYEGVGQCNRLLETERRQKEWLTCSFTGKTMSNRSSLGGSSLGEYFPAACESSQGGCRKAHEHDQTKAEQCTKKIFGVEISGSKHDPSVMTSDKFLLTLKPQSLAANLDACSIFGKNLPSNGVLDLNKNLGTSMHVSEVIGDRLHCNGNGRLVPSPGAEVSYKNSVGYISQMESKESWDCQPSVGLSCIKGNNNINSASAQAPQHITSSNLRSSGWLVNSKSAEVNVNSVPEKGYQKDIVPDASLTCIDGPNKAEATRGGLPWLRTLSVGNKNSSNGRNDPHVNLDPWHNYSQQFVSNAEMRAPSCSFIQDSLSVTNTKDVEKRKLEAVEHSSNKKILGVPIFEKEASNSTPSGNSDPKSNYFSLVNNDVKSIKVGLLHTDLNEDPIPFESQQVLSKRSLEIENESVDCRNNLRNHIDLNVIMTEEEVQVTTFSPRNTDKTAVVIDLEAPIDVETETHVSSGDGFLRKEFQGVSQPIDDESSDSHEGSVRVAAKVLVAFSSSNFLDFQDHATCNELEASPFDSLQWFAEKISSFQGYIENDALSISAGKNSSDCEDSQQDEVDFFEYMTLNLVESKVEVFDYEALVLENKNAEPSSRRPRRGQARRGRQRRDFQRDVLPNIVPLSRNDVTEDLQTIEQLVRATGGNWQSSLLQRNNPNSKRGRGRKRTAASGVSPTVTSVSLLPSQQQPACGEVGLEETRLAGWGKRTRRPPRQKYPSNPPFPIQ